MTPDDRFDELPRMIRDRIRRDPEEMGGHWYWTGGVSQVSPYCSYGRLTLPPAHRGQRARRVYAHRYVYLLLDHDPAGDTIDHLCGEHLCCRPSHLEPVSSVENTRRRWAKTSLTTSMPIGLTRPVDFGMIADYWQPPLDWEAP